MTTACSPWEAFPSRAAVEDDDTARAHEPVRRTLARLLAEATPPGWTVVTGSRCASGAGTVDLDIAVRPGAADDVGRVPLLCVDVDAGDDATGGARRRARLRSLAELGVDHYWSIDTDAATLDVWLRTERQYRHAETLLDEDWLDYGVGIVRLDLHHLLQT